MKNVIIILLLILAFSSCSTTKQVATENRTKTHYEREVIERRDSIYLYKHDSIFMLVKGDTVFVEKYRTLYKYRDRGRVDTVIKTDSIFATKTVVKIVEPSKWQVFWEVFGKIVGVLLLIVAICYFINRKFGWLNGL